MVKELDEQADPLIKEQISLIEQKIFVQPVYDSGTWCYVLHKPPSDKDIKLAESEERQDADLWRQSQQLNKDWYMQEHPSFLDALKNGISHAKGLISSKD